MMIQKFKKGDQVQCIIDQPSNQLIKDNIYTIRGYEQDNPENIYPLVRLEELETAFYEPRFILHKATEPKQEEKLNFPSSQYYKYLIENYE